MTVPIAYETSNDQETYKKYNSNENIHYDYFIKSCKGAWQVQINNEDHFFPYSICIIDEKSKVILCPMWFIVDHELETYIET